MIEGIVNHRRASIRAISFLLCLIPAGIQAGTVQPNPSASTQTPATPGTETPIIVIGFVGGYVKHDALTHSAVQVAAHLRHDYPSGVYAKAHENHRPDLAYAEIVRLLDTDGDGTLSADEKRNAHIILYGHSWGASEAIALARELEKQGIPVLLTVQVDSVSKPGQNDKVIPANVEEAANFYQVDGFLHGQPQIRAADPAHTRIIGNFRFDYKGNPLQCQHYPWYDKVFMKSHIQIECDPQVWNQVESLIQSRLPQQVSNR